MNEKAALVTVLARPSNLTSGEGAIGTKVVRRAIQASSL